MRCVTARAVVTSCSIPFMGSGTTILAAERVGRRGYGLEIDPLYVDAAVRRWQTFTKRDAILKATGQTFDEVAAARSSKQVAEDEMTAKTRQRRSRPRVRIKKPSRKTLRLATASRLGSISSSPDRAAIRRVGPKGAKNESTILREIFERKIDTRSGDRVRKITVLEGILLRITEDSLKGNTKSAAFLLNRYAVMVSGELQRHDISDDDREVLEAFAQRIEAQRAIKEEKP